MNQHQNHNERNWQRCEKRTRNYNRHAGEQLSPLHQGQLVWVLDHDTVIRIRDEPHSYVVALDNGSTLRRNGVDLRTRAKSSTDPDDQSPSSSGRHGNGHFRHTQDYRPPSASSYLDRQGGLQKIKVKRNTYNRRGKILVKTKTYSRRSRTLNCQSIGISKVNNKQEHQALSGYPTISKLKSD